MSQVIPRPLLDSRPKPYFRVRTSYVDGKIETLVEHGIGVDRDEVRMLRVQGPPTFGGRPPALDRIYETALPQHEAGCQIALKMTDEEAHTIKAKNRPLLRKDGES